MKLKLLVILFASILTGCNSGDSSSGGNGDSSSGGNGDSSSGGSGDSSRVKWSYDVGSNSYIYYSSVALSEDEQSLYFGTSKKIRSESSGNDSLIALNRDGSLKWKYSLTGGEEVRSTPVVAQDIICFIADLRTGEFSKKHTNLVCLNEADGLLLFEKSISSNTLMSSTGLSKVVIKDNKVFAVMEHFYVFDATNGNELYKSDRLQTKDTYVNPVVLGSEILFILNGELSFISMDSYATRRIGITGITTSTVLSTPAIDSSNRIYFGSESGEIIAIDATGSLLWKKDLNPSNSVDGPYIRSSIAINERLGQIYVGTKNNDNSKFVALNISTGEVKWEHRTGGDVYSSPLIGNNGNIYVGSESKYVHAFDSNGTEVWKVRVSQDITWPSPSIDTQGVIYIGGMGKGSGNGKLFAIRTDSSGLMLGTWSKIHKNNQNTGY